MNWITNIVRPRIKGLMGGKDRGDTPDNLWRKCPSCGEMIFHRDLVAAQNVCPQCGHHLRIGPAERFAYTFDAGRFAELTPPTVAADPLRFKGDSTSNTTAATGQNKFETQLAIWLTMRQRIH